MQSLILCQIFLTLVMTFVQISIGKPFADILMLLDVPLLCFAWTRNSLCISESLYFLKLKTNHCDWFLFTKKKKKKKKRRKKKFFVIVKVYKDLKRKPAIEAILERQKLKLGNITLQVVQGHYVIMYMLLLTDRRIVYEL